MAKVLWIGIARPIQMSHVSPAKMIRPAQRLLESKLWRLTCTRIQKSDLLTVPTQVVTRAFVILEA